MAERIVNGVRYRRIPGFSRYEVGDDGSVLSWIKRGSNTDASEPTALRPTESSDSGYLYVTISNDERRIVRKAVHHLVLEAFVGPCQPGMEACHDPDPTRTNCHLTNLRWDTRKNNHADKRRHGTHQAGELNGSHILSEAQVLEIKQRLVRGETQRTIARDYGVDHTTIGAIRRRRLWSHVAPDLHELFPSRRIEVRAAVAEKPMTLRQLAISRGIRPRIVYKRLRSGYTLDEALNPTCIKGFRFEEGKKMLERKSA